MPQQDETTRPSWRARGYRLDELFALVFVAFGLISLVTYLRLMAPDSGVTVGLAAIQKVYARIGPDGVMKGRTPDSEFFGAFATIGLGQMIFWGLACALYLGWKRLYWNPKQRAK